MITYSTVPYVGLDSAVGIATRYGLNGPRIESWWCMNVCVCVVGEGGGAMSTYAHLGQRLKKKYSYTPSPPRGLRGLTTLGTIITPTVYPILWHI
jgi:hypothetical protein